MAAVWRGLTSAQDRQRVRPRAFAIAASNATFFGLPLASKRW